MARAKKRKNQDLLTASYKLASDVVLVRDLHQSLLVVRPKKNAVYQIDGFGMQLLPHFKPGIEVVHVIELLAPQMASDRQFRSDTRKFIKQMVKIGVVKRVGRG